MYFDVADKGAIKVSQEKTVPIKAYKVLPKENQRLKACNVIDLPDYRIQGKQFLLDM